MTAHQEVAVASLESATAKAARRMARDAKVVRLAREGLRPRDISERLGVGPSTITDILRAAGVRAERGALPLGCP